MRLTTKILTLTILTVLIASMVATAYAATVTVKIGSISSQQKGHWTSHYWIGQIPITLNSQEQTYSYCMDYDKVIYIGTTYSATTTSPPDTDAWKSISYILTWYDPPTTNDGAVANQLAIWKLLKGSLPTDLSDGDKTLGNNLVAAVTGKDVLRQGDTLSWTLPSGLVDGGAVPGAPGGSIYFEVQVKDSTGAVRPGVKITFDASPLLGPTDAWTDVNGKAGVTVNIPSNQPQGSSVDIRASTRGTYPKLYLDLSTPGNPQDLIGIDTSLELTLDASAVVIARINMIPEIEMGTLAAVSLMAFGFLAWTKKKKNKA
jgi:hypothetical protein